MVYICLQFIFTYYIIQLVGPRVFFQTTLKSVDNHKEINESISKFQNFEAFSEKLFIFIGMEYHHLLEHLKV